MGRRIFAEGGFNDLKKHILSCKDFKLYSDKPEGFKIAEEQKPELIKRAEKMLDTPIPQLLASEYMLYRKTGNRVIYQDKCHFVREMLLTVALGEYIEREGRFTDKLIDLIWCVLEETSWVLPAHNAQEITGMSASLPASYAGKIDYIDIFAGTTGADLAFVYYLHHDMLDNITPIICERILFELDRRIIKPYMNEDFMREKNWWSAMKGNKVNNWCPWIISNILTVTALTVKDTDTKEYIMRRAMDALDVFTSYYHPDGGCEEGPTYWEAAGGALINACEVLYDMSGGYINVYGDPLIKNMGEYAVKVVVTKRRALNFADSDSIMTPDPMLVYHWGTACGSEFMTSYAKWKLDGKLCRAYPDYFFPYKWLKYMTEGPLPISELVLPEKFFIDGIEVAVTRESSKIEEGLYLAMKGGNNDESHNHNDLGSIVVFNGAEPVFVDVGRGHYTAKTFSAERYSIWSMCSDYHNCAILNGATQPAGHIYKTDKKDYDKESGRLTLGLTSAYPEEAKLKKYERTSSLKDSVITVVDDIEFTEKCEVVFTFMAVNQPSEVKANSFVLGGTVVNYDPSLCYELELCDTSAPEVNRITRVWGTERIYRIKLKSREPIKSKKYTLTIKAL